VLGLVDLLDNNLESTDSQIKQSNKLFGSAYASKIISCVKMSKQENIFLEKAFLLLYEWPLT